MKYEIEQIYDQLLKKYSTHEKTMEILNISEATLKQYLKNGYCPERIKIIAIQENLEIKSVLEYYKEALNARDAQVMDNIAQFYYKNEDYSSYLNITYEILRIIIKEKRSETQIKLYHCIDLAKKLNDTNMLFKFEVLFLFFSNYWGDYSEAKRLIKNLWRRNLSTYHKFDIAELTYHTGYYNYIQKKYEDAIYFFKKAIPNYENKMHIWDCKTKIAICYKYLHQYNLAEDLYKTLIDDPEFKKNAKLYICAINNFAEMHKTKGDIQKALTIIDSIDCSQFEDEILGLFILNCTKVECLGSLKQWNDVEKMFFEMSQSAINEKYIVSAIKVISESITDRADKQTLIKILDPLIQKSKLKSKEPIKSILYDMIISEWR